MNRPTGPERSYSDPALQAGVTSARLRSLQWLAEMQAPGQPEGVSRISAAQDTVRWPGMLLPGTYNAVMARELLGDLAGWSDDRRQALAAWLESHRRADGVFRIRAAACSKKSCGKNTSPVSKRVAVYPAQP